MSSEVRSVVLRRLRNLAGGADRLHVVALLAAVLALDSADQATVGAVAPSLESSLGIGDAKVGMLVSISTAATGLATIPAGVLVDHRNRVRLLSLAIAMWSVALMLGGLVDSWAALLASRLTMGAVAAGAWPAVASLVGNLFPPADRGRVYGLILSGEMVGSGIGFLVSGNLAAILSWREAFWMLGTLGLALAWLIPRLLDEPVRGRGDRTSSISLQEAARRILRLRTNRSLIAASALGYYFFAGLRTFAVPYVHRRYGLPASAASTLLVLLAAGAIVGAIVTGRLGDRLMELGHRAARPALAGTAFLACVVIFCAALTVRGPLAAAAPMLFLGAAALGAVNPPLDAARLDLVDPELWGRAEGIRTLLRSALQAPAPLLFGGLAAAFSATPDGTATGSGLTDTFLVMLAAPLVGGLLLLLRASRTYAADAECVPRGPVHDSDECR